MRTQSKGMNSFASLRPLFDIEIDLKDMGGQTTPLYYRDGLVGTDHFKKEAWVAHIYDKKPSSLIEGTKVIIQDSGKSELLYSDQERGISIRRMADIHQRLKGKALNPNYGAHTVERFNRTLKSMLGIGMASKSIPRHE